MSILQYYNYYDLFSLLQDHIKNCKFAIVVCSNPSCDVHVVRGELDKHLATCPYKPISCRYCQAKIPANKKQVMLIITCSQINESQY